MGLYYFQDEEYEQAEIYFKQSLLINENQSETHLNLGI
ncbi:hypothetical protein [Paenibacillus monticola]